MLRTYLLALSCLIASELSLATPDVQLAELYSDDINIEDFLISEKYDGVRGIWTGNELLTRQGNPIHAPRWFTEKLPNVWLDGELWTKRGDFATVLSIVSKNVPIDSEWRQIHYMIFDAPDYQHTFQERSKHYTELVEQLHLPFVIAIKQFTVKDRKALSDALDHYVVRGAEGLVLHRKSAMFQSGRTDNLLKLKPYMDGEAKVIEILPGDGKYTGMMGAILVETIDGLRFRIGTGFTDKERANPPKPGDIITYKYHGFTQSGLPRFASFIRVRYSAGSEQPF